MARCPLASLVSSSSSAFFALILCRQAAVGSTAGSGGGSSESVATASRFEQVADGPVELYRDRRAQLTE